MTRWLVDYDTPEWKHHKIIIWCKTRSEVRGILKNHLGNNKFSINRITKEGVLDEGQ